jgi:CRP-like cAMP-binding protein
LDERVEFLQFCPVLEEFTDVGLQILASVVRQRLFPNAAPLQVQGELPKENGVLFIATGRIRCEVTDSSGKILGLGTLGPGDHLGGLRLFGDIPSPLSAIAEGDVTAYLLDRPAFARLRKHKPQAAMKLLFALAGDFGRRLADAGGLFTDFAQYAALRANMSERGTYASYADLGIGLTPTAQLFSNIPTDKGS